MKTLESHIIIRAIEDMNLAISSPQQASLDPQRATSFAWELRRPFEQNSNGQRTQCLNSLCSLCPDNDVSSALRGDDKTRESHLAFSSISCFSLLQHYMHVCGSDEAADHCCAAVVPIETANMNAPRSTYLSGDLLARK